MCYCARPYLRKSRVAPGGSGAYAAHPARRLWLPKALLTATGRGTRPPEAGRPYPRTV